jgi:hypothetical protein
MRSENPRKGVEMGDFDASGMEIPMLLAPGRRGFKTGGRVIMRREGIVPGKPVTDSDLQPVHTAVDSHKRMLNAFKPFKGFQDAWLHPPPPGGWRR